MIRQYYTLLHLSKELDSKLKGYVVFEAFSQEKNSVVLSLYHPHNQHSTNIVISVDAVSGTFYLDSQFSRKRTNVTDVFSILLQKEFQFSTVMPQERVLNIYFTNYRVECVFYGGANGTIGVYSPENVLLEGLKILSDKQPSSLERKSFEYFVTTASSIKVSKLLSNSEFAFSSYYSEEVASRCLIKANDTIENFDSEKIEQIRSEALLLQQELLTSNSYFILSNEKEKIFSLIPLTKFPKIEKAFTLVSDGVRTMRWMRQYEGEYSELHKKLEYYFEKAIAKNESILRNISQDFHNEDKIEIPRTYSEILYSLPKDTQLAKTPLEITHWDGKTYSIPVDLQLTISENAQLFREKSVKVQKSKERLVQRRIIVDTELERLKTKKREFDQITTLKELTKFAETIRLQQHKGKHETFSKFKEFTIHNQYKVYIGKGASNNDELTFRFAKPNDIWLHARSVSGSHGIIKMNTKQGIVPPKEVLEEAAALVAYYSKSRNGTMVPVSYTFKKYVRKKKGFADGAVIMEREEVLFVEPKKPSENKEEM